MTSKPRLLGIVTVLTLLFAVWGFEIHARHSAEAARPVPQVSSAASNDLRQLMSTRVHEDRTGLSFTIWHYCPLYKRKNGFHCVPASGRIMGAAKGLEPFEATYKQQGWSAADVKFFNDKRLQLSHVAEELNRAAKNRDESQVVSFFMHLDNTCQSCHKRFRPDLSWT